MKSPAIQCPRAEFSPVAADLAAAPWAELPAVELCEAVTGTIPQQRSFYAPPLIAATTCT